jgi:hypothetical protein
VSKRSATILGVLVAAAGSALIAFSARDAGDYSTQVAPAVNALAHGDLSRFFEVQPVYGSFSVLVRAPFAAIAYGLGGNELLGYRLGALVCLLAAGLLGAYLARAAAARGQGALGCVAISTLPLLNPATFAAIHNGHPEELLAAALAVGAVLIATRGRPLWAGLLLALAVSTKQWAVLAILPAMLAAPPGGRLRLRLGLLATLTTLALMVPLAVANPERFAHNARQAEGATHHASRYSVWWLFSSAESETVSLGTEVHEVTVHRLPRHLAGLGRPLTIASAVLLCLLYARRRSRPEDLFGLLALVLLLRCVLDPLDNAYYHVAFLLSLLAWESLTMSGLPTLTLISAAALWGTFRHALLVAPALNNGFYLSWTVGIAAWLGLCLFAPRFIEAVANRLSLRGRLALTAERSTIHARNA